MTGKAWKATVLAVLLCMAVGLTGCADFRGTLIDGRIDNSNERIAGVYEKFTGEAKESHKFTPGKYTVEMSSSTYAGTLKITMIHGEEQKSFDNPVGVSEELTIDRPAEVKFVIEGNEHSGDFIIVWKKA